MRETMIPPTTLYGILDLACAPELFEHVARLEPAGAACLFEGRLDSSVARASPHLVELAPSDPLTITWQNKGWGQSWGILIASREPLGFVRRRLRHFTQARLPGGEGPVLFRFWDPRVFRVYLPLVEPAQLPPWFKGIDRYICETEDGGASLHYTFDGNALEIQSAQPPGRPRQSAIT
jgi:hypothetical protein